jgi:hypothetical protein
MISLKLLLPLLLASSFAPATAQSPAPAPVAPASPANAASYNLLAAQVEGSLQRDVADAWFPRAVDRERGGFHQNFSNSWEKQASDERSIVYQARLTWLAAQLSERYPARRVEFQNYASKVEASSGRWARTTFLRQNERTRSTPMEMPSPSTPSPLCIAQRATRAL